MNSAPVTFDRYVVAAAVVLTCGLFLPSASDPVNVAKLTALLLTAIMLIVSAVARVLQDRVVHVPVSLAGASAVALLLAFVVSTLVAPVTTTAVLGSYGRNSGLLAYAAAIVLFLVGLRVFDRPGTRVLVGAVVAAGLFTASYGLLQRAGWDLVPWTNPFNPIIAALGNPNFASAYLGIAASAACGGALWTGWSRGWRVGCAVTAVLCLTTAALSSSVQGPIAAAGGLFVVAVAWLLDQPSGRRRGGLGVLVTSAVGGTALLVAGLVAKAGPAAGIFSDAGSRARAYYWEAAITMFADRPLLGVGLDQYGSFWPSSRSAASLDFLASNDVADAAHSVPLQMLAQGGVLLGAAYTAFVLATGLALVRGLARLRGPDRILLSAVGGAWAAYQVQSLVSIDQVPLLVLHFSLAGAVVAAAGCSGFRELRLPGTLPVSAGPTASRPRRRAAPVLQQRRARTGGDTAVLGAVGLLALVASYLVFVPLRADVAAKDGDEHLTRGRGDASLAAYEQAVGLLPGRATYWLKLANLFDALTPPAPARAQDAYEAAVEADPRNVNAVLGLARVTESTGQLDRSRTLHHRAVELSPLDEAVLLRAASFELRHDRAEAARQVLVEATRHFPDSAAAWSAFGEAQQSLGDADAARTAYERALAIDPAHPVATEGLRLVD